MDITCLGQLPCGEGSLVSCSHLGQVPAYTGTQPREELLKKLVRGYSPPKAPSQIGSLENYYLFEHRRLMKRSTTQARHHHTKLRREPEVLWVQQQVLRKRVKRDLIEPSPRTSGGNWKPQWTDPGWKSMWYLALGGPSRLQGYLRGYGGHLWQNKGAHGHYDMNVVEAWKQGYTGKGVVVTILDDGIERTHTDLMSNYICQFHSQFLARGFKSSENAYSFLSNE
ncbi:hypothetical protein NP493_102g03020 [Ridgeia piscesae]|uniref:Peptidase S8 pro-domain domain-containing protein n=1 Tax=Ridgeia piscesae TaxID=27915 RepID=A0AAD9P7I8_RIDPI|nr:hypothetical protein NP493_102g03020 [Ridgeia piscesae]